MAKYLGIEKRMGLTEPSIEETMGGIPVAISDALLLSYDILPSLVRESQWSCSPPSGLSVADSPFLEISVGSQSLSNVS
jgi:hypothetical protein